MTEQRRVQKSVPVLREVHKLVQQYTTSKVAQRALFELGESLDVADLDEVSAQSRWSMRLLAGKGRSKIRQHRDSRSLHFYLLRIISRL